MSHRHPPAEVEVDAGLVRRLLEEQHPELLTGEPDADLRQVDEGWDNFLFRLGADLAVRLPRRLVAVQLLRNEQRWLPSIAERLPVAVPVPVAVGEPSELFPWPWSVVRWLDGAPADGGPLPVDQAAPLAEVLRRLHLPADACAPVNPFRGVPLADRVAVVEERLGRVGSPSIAKLWRQAVAAPPARTAVWIHGDLHPRNVLVRGGEIAGILDWGDLTAGDAATDLGCAWMLFDAEGRRTFLDAYGASATQRLRAVGWAINVASALADSGDPRHLHSLTT